ncbi:GroES-like protein [Glonium stellatum]|uniref:GroES-like protein n=1 Tax=Glonium stellatum TaxID=574774 RepID=A0A8E2FA88_9PEZI|nr:GroES-like protein [Glonium stellatum]
MPTNTAAWLRATGAPLDIAPAPYPSPSGNEIVIQTAAIAINPVDWAIQARGDAYFPWVHFPAVLGSDVAGTVTAVGSDVTRFRPGDRVVGHALGITAAAPRNAAFQTFVVLHEHMASRIPAALAFERAAVLPLALSTAAAGLFLKDYLALAYPTVPPRAPVGETLLVWGGSTSVGCNAIQLAVAAGYEVFTTASPHNWELMKKLGASAVWDYRSETVVEELVEALRGKKCAGAIASASAFVPGAGPPNAAPACVEIVARSEGKKFVALAMRPPEGLGEQVESKFIVSYDLKDNEASKVVYEDFLPRALEDGAYIAAPDPEVVGKGLESLQTAFDIQKKGVSAKKVVVTL